MGDNKQSGPSKVIRAIPATKAKGSEKMSETMINKKKYKRGQQESEQVKNKSAGEKRYLYT